MPIGLLDAVGIEYSLVTFGVKAGPGVAVPLVRGVPFPHAASKVAVATAQIAERNKTVVFMSQSLLADFRVIPAQRVS
jgi:hypothetical protein